MFSFNKMLPKYSRSAYFYCVLPCQVGTRLQSGVFRRQLQCFKKQKCFVATYVIILHPKRHVLMNWDLIQFVIFTDSWMPFYMKQALCYFAWFLLFFYWQCHAVRNSTMTSGEGWYHCPAHVALWLSIDYEWGGQPLSNTGQAEQTSLIPLTRMRDETEKGMRYYPNMQYDYLIISCLNTSYWCHQLRLIYLFCKTKLQKEHLPYRKFDKFHANKR